MGEDLSQVRAGESLVLGSGAQLRLLDVDEVGLPAAAYADLEARGRFTGERIFSGNPKLYHAIVKLLARNNLSYREIGDICSVGVNTVCGIAFRERIPVETIRERIGRTALSVAELSLDAMKDLLTDPVQRGTFSLKELAVAFGVATQNAQLLLGGATQRIESTQAAIPDHEAYLAAMKNVTASLMGLRAGNSAANGAGGAVAGEPGGRALEVGGAEKETEPDAPAGGDSGRSEGGK